MKRNYLFFQSFLLLLFCGSIVAQPGNATLNASGTYIVPAGYTAVVTIECWGGGGSGGGGGAGNGERTGGGGGAYASTSGVTLVAGTYTVTVGTGGVAPAASGAGINGGITTFFTGGTNVIAAGGTAGSNTANPGLGGAGGTVAASTGTIRFAGGTGGARPAANGGGGGGGSSAGTAAIGNNGAIGVAAGAGGAGGVAPAGGGSGGAGGPNGGAAVNGIAPGGGGGGKGNNPGPTSGNGANGRVIVTVTNVLAIKITYLNAEKGTGYNTLNWQANCSSSQAIFDVQRSVDGRIFTSINTITANQLRCLQPFSYTDNANNTASTLFYRIKITDVDGRVTYSSIVKLTDQARDMLLVGVSPNPVSNIAQLSVTVAKKDKVELQVVSIEGRVLQRSPAQVQPGTSIINLDVSLLQKGMYTIKGTFANGQTSIVKFMKQ
jgi:hypothetical protein